MTEIIYTFTEIIILIITAEIVGFFISIISAIKSIRVMLDRYRLKYGFDKELESMDTKDANRLANREKRFNKRMADYAEKKYGVKK